MGINEATLETIINLAEGLDWNNEMARRFAESLDSNGVMALLIALEDVSHQSGDESIVDLVREVVAREYGPYEDHEDRPIAVVFEADEWDNGYFLDARHGTVFFAYGSHDEGLDFSEVNDVMTETYGKVAPKASLGVHLVTGAVEYSESGADVCLLLGIKDLEVARQSEGRESDGHRPPTTN